MAAFIAACAVILGGAVILDRIAVEISAATSDVAFTLWFVAFIVTMLVLGIIAVVVMAFVG